MNKILNKIAMLSLSFAMALGIGISVKAANEMKAAKAIETSSLEQLTDVSQIESGSKYIIAGLNGSNYYALPTNPTVESGKITGTIFSEISSTSGYLWTFESTGSYWKVTDGSKNLYHSKGGSSGTDLEYGIKTQYPWSITYKEGFIFAGVNGSTVNSRGMLFSTSSTIFGGYSLTNATKTGYSKIFLFKEKAAAVDDVLNSVSISSTNQAITQVSSLQLKVEDNYQLYLLASYQNEGLKDVTGFATWESSDTSVATINGGKITALNIGTTTITASFNDKSAASFTLTVVAKPTLYLGRYQVTPFLEKQVMEDITIEYTNFNNTPNITASSSSTNLAVALKENNSKLSITAGDNLTEDERVTVTVTAKDGSDSDSAEIAVFLKAPTLTLPASEIKMKPTADASEISITASNFDSNLSFSVTNTNTGAYTAEISNSNLIITPLAEGTGSVTVTASDGTRSREVTVPVTIANVKEYELVTDANSLTEGSELIIASTVSSATYAMSTQSGSYRTVATTNLVGTTISEPSEDVKLITLEGSVGEWKFAVDDGYLTLSSSSNAINTVETSESACTWSITITDGVAKIIPSTYPTKQISFNSSSNPKRIACYTSVQNSIKIYGIIAQTKTIEDARINTTNGKVEANYLETTWNISGFTFEVKYEGETSWNQVSARFEVVEAVPEQVGETTVTLIATYAGVKYSEKSVKVKAQVIDSMTPIKSFYDGTIEVTTSESSSSYIFRGTAISIEGNSYYLQDGEYGILVYGASIPVPTGLKVGDLVVINATVINYSGYILETKTITKYNGTSGRILGTGTLPVAPIVTSISEFVNANQSTRITFNGLKRSDEGETITWAQNWTASSTHGLAKVQDSTGGLVWIYVSKFLSSEVGTAIVNTLNSIKTTDTFNLFQSVRAVNTNNFSSIGGTVDVDYPARGTAYISITNVEEIVIVAQDSDPIQVWIDAYLYMDDELFNGEGTGLCSSNNLYINAKKGLKAVEVEHEGSIAKFSSNEGEKYTSALARYNAWARACGDANPFDGNDEIVSKLSKVVFISSQDFSALTIFAAISLAGICLTFFIIKKRKTI